VVKLNQASDEDTEELVERASEDDPDVTPEAARSAADTMPLVRLLATDIAQDVIDEFLRSDDTADDSEASIERLVASTPTNSHDSGPAYEAEERPEPDYITHRVTENVNDFFERPSDTYHGDGDDTAARMFSRIEDRSNYE
jgi:hypothetical protein